MTVSEEAVVLGREQRSQISELVCKFTDVVSESVGVYIITVFEHQVLCFVIGLI